MNRTDDTPARRPRRDTAPSAPRRVGRHAQDSGHPTRRAGLRRAALITARMLAATTALAVLTGTGLAWSAKNDFDSGFTHSTALGEDAPRSRDGAVNILLIGLDTRKDLDGNDLPKEILDQLHAGDGTEGGYNANSLILLHIPADLSKIVAFSIPRDDYVPVTGIPGYQQVKIKEAYGLKKAAVQAELIEQGEKDPVVLERRGREAGRASIVTTVRNLVGVPIDRFAEISLAGFYDLATAVGGVDVCLNNAVDDSEFSGAVFPAGRQHLNGAEALAFVRQRHGLRNGDLDRTHRQQAFLTSVAKSLKDSGTLTNLSRLAALMDMAHKDVVLSDGWNLFDFARELGAAGSLPVEFRTLPVLRYDVIDGQDVNIVDPAAIKREVRAAFGQQPSTTSAAPAPTSVVDVHNVSGIVGQAATVSAALAKGGYRAGEIGNGTLDDGPYSAITYGPGAGPDATALAESLGGLPVAESASVTAGHIRLVVGSDFTLPAELAPTTTTSATPTTATAAPGVSSTPLPDAGKPVTTTIGSTIPCVN
ncbi:LCP family protein [Nocardia asteroides]|uniref:LytR family transcriptional regulator n=1 Tax=Nocardia asteroides NBRC 15531 TaxID=1110697 RepID=U5EHV6_NOCAS|nr:LCP family protein [Nocardia asteroides]UGT47382.1 LCP family protein [Nocardia asteroides]GAD86880.1 putative LytR family transcriptional regulator [Nocardia asteroides NBRC 15531]SFN78587.1 transcriptional attenuator, LytR family [Nocardia asteroides]VEG33721.1 Putative transcriptional regulator yvhJ [Nocardia asteroides]